jgi:hypothetical protein
VGLDYLPGGRVYINDIWERLQSWYIDNGTLEIVTSDSGKEKKLWHDQPRRGDKNVRAPNQVYQRFAELFPKIKREKETEYQERRGQSYLAGISFEERGTRKLTSQSRGSYEAINEAVTLTEQANEPNEAIKPALSEISQTLEQLDPESLKALSLMLSGQTKQVLSQGNEGSTGSFDSYPCPEGDVASLTGSLTGSLLPRSEEADPPNDDSEQQEETKECSELGVSNSELKPNNSADVDTRSALPTTNYELLIDWVRYRGEPWRVARQNENGWLWLRKSGLTKIVHKVHVSQVEIGGYK